MYFQRTKTYGADKSLFASSSNIQKPRAELLELTYLSKNADSDYVVPSGSFIAELYTSSNVRVVRPLPRAVLTSAASTGAATFTTNYSYFFVPGDVLYVALARAIFTVATTGAGSLTYNNTVVSYTPTGAATTGEATTMSASFYNNSILGRFFYFVADATNSKLYVFDKTAIGGNDITGDATVLQGTVGGAGAAQTTLVNTTALGTVSTVATNGTVTLTANSAIAVPVGVSIGVKISDIIGMTTATCTLSTDRPSTYQGLCVEGNVYKGGLVYYDVSIGNDSLYLPKLIIKEKF
jgi:hypothetical protein